MFDLSVVLGLQRLMGASPIWIGVAIFLARVLVFIPVIVLLGFCVHRRYQKRARHVLGELSWAVILALGMVNLLGLIVQRPRPFLSSLDVFRLIPAPLTSSFPSGHSAVAFAVAVVIMRESRSFGIAAVVCALLVGLGRMLVGVHYPSDVFAGVLFGVVSGWIVFWGHKQLRLPDLRRWVKRK